MAAKEVVLTFNPAPERNSRRSRVVNSCLANRILSVIMFLVVLLTFNVSEQESKLIVYSCNSDF